MSKFCHNCGKSQSNPSAKFCFDCGTSLNSLASKPTPPVETFKPFIANSEDEDDSYIDRIDHLNIRLKGLDVEISKPVTQVEKLGNIAATVSPQIASAESRGIGPFANLTPEQAKEQFAREAGSRVNNSKIYPITVDES